MIDTPPALGIITVNALVVDASAGADSGLLFFDGRNGRLLETLERIRARPNPGLKLFGVIITLYDKRTNIARDIYGQIRRYLARFCSRR